MFDELLTKIFGSRNDRLIKQYRRKCDAINKLEPAMQALSDEELKAKTQEFRDRIAKGATTDELLPEAFAVVREASVRVLGMRHFDVQLIGAMVLNDGKIAEMRTGEGKTLTATLAVYLNALPGKGCHVVTVNDYLASRDADWMGRLYNWLGLSVGKILSNQNNEEKRAAYASDITYGTNNEFGFDYLRDNMKFYKEQLVQRGHNFAIVDEVDSILIDEARTPLIISGASDESTELYQAMDAVVRQLKAEEDYTLDEKSKTAMLTDAGVAKCEKILGIDNLFDPASIAYQHHILQSLKAHHCFKRDVDYIVSDEGKVVIVDEFTGRLMPGRRFSDGLHQALEAKEGVKVEAENQTLASITFQNYFRMYDKLSGMTGTAQTEAVEFDQIYHLETITIPTNKPMIRKDLNDMVYKTKRGKFNAVVEEIVKRHQTGQPILVGTVNVETSEMLSHLIKLRGVSHEVLNAKNHQKEAEIVAQAGHVGAVTIATNMAGRGTDILLGGNPDFLARRAMRQENYPDEIIEAATGHNENVDQVVLDARKRYRELYEGFKKETDAEHERVMALGGLHIIGTERHESRRIDNQLRGRAGRQGDPGSTQFFISLEDDVMRLFGSERIAPMIEKLGMTEDQPLEAGMLTKQIEGAQKRIEGRNYSIRKSVLQYDDVMNKQRELIYGQRRDILMGHDVRQNIIDMVHKLIDSTAERNFTGEGSFDWSIDDARDYLEKLCLKPGAFDSHAEAIKTMEEPEELVKLLYADAEAFYAEREALLSGMGIDMREFERVVLLSAIDHHWMDHIDAMDDLRDGIGLRAYGQRDPVQEYRMESYDMFNDMVHFIREETVRRLYQARVERLPERRRTVNLDAAKASLQGEENTNGQAKKGGAPTNKAMPGAPGRNQPCPCGSGKKYKHCCGAGK